MFVADVIILPYSRKRSTYSGYIDTRTFHKHFPCNNLTCIKKIEYVEITMSSKVLTRSSDVVLISPSGTHSVILSLSPGDTKPKGNIRLLSSHFWGESAVGRWKLLVKKASSVSGEHNYINRTITLNVKQ